MGEAFFGKSKGRRRRPSLHALRGDGRKVISLAQHRPAHRGRPCCPLASRTARLAIAGRLASLPGLLLAVCLRMLRDTHARAPRERRPTRCLSLLRPPPLARATTCPVVPFSTSAETHKEQHSAKREASGGTLISRPPARPSPAGAAARAPVEATSFGRRSATRFRCPSSLSAFAHVAPRAPTPAGPSPNQINTSKGLPGRPARWGEPRREESERGERERPEG